MLCEYFSNVCVCTPRGGGGGGGDDGSSDEGDAESDGRKKQLEGEYLLVSYSCVLRTSILLLTPSHHC